MSTVSGSATLVMLTPGQMRAQATAIYFLVIGVTGPLIGPPVIGPITDWFGDPRALRFAMSIAVTELNQRLAADVGTCP